MNKETQPLFEQCPLGCPSPLIVTGIELPEGKLRQCPECGQLLSACSQAWYDESMQEFDVPEGTLPQGGSRKRHEQRITQILQLARPARWFNRGHDMLVVLRKPE